MAVALKALLLLFPVLMCFLLPPVFASSTTTCIEEERQALIEFKKNLTDPAGKAVLTSWSGEDCCTWLGIRCDTRTGHVTQISLGNNSLAGDQVPSSLLHLKHLVSLDLSHNFFNLAPVPEFFGSFPQLRYLNLSSGGFGGKFPQQLGNLSKLQYLDLSGCNLELSKTVYHLPPSLIELHLQYFYSPYGSTGDDNISTFTLSTNLTSLKVLDVSADIAVLSVLPKWLSGLNSLTTLILNYGFQGTIPAWFCTLGNLKYLDMSVNYLEGRIPSCFANLSRLAYLDLSYNNFDGPLSPESTVENLAYLEMLNLAHNNFEGDLPCRLTKWQNLQELSLEHNLFSGTIPSSLGRLSSLQKLRFGDNNLTGSIPESLGMLSHLEELDVSHNNYLEGIVNEIHFTHLTSLISLGMSSTSVAWNVSSDWNPPFQLFYLDVSSSTLGPRFPTWLLTQEKLISLDISCSNISDVVPNSFWDLLSSVSYLNMSHNRLRGQLPDFLNVLPNYSYSVIDLSHNSLKGSLLNFSTNAYTLDISSNLISGQIPKDVNIRMRTIHGLFLSDNHITGSIPFSLCQLQMEVLSLSRNKLSGAIPDCWNSSGSLKSIDLSRNNLDGNVPATLSNLPSLVSVYLSVNNLSGGLLPMLQSRFPELIVLDLGENKLVGRIPSHIGEKLPKLMVLRLRSNMLFGHVPSGLSLLASLRILDLAQNNLSGNIPESFSNFSAMKVWNKASELNNFLLGYLEIQRFYYEKVSVSIKGGEWEYRRQDVAFTFLCNIDLSCNKLSGEIPNGLADLLGLLSMNLSNNRFTGKIPNRIGDLQQLESLDFSHNQLYGKIPDSISALHYLEYMNLSYNNLSGRIPQGSQIQTLDDPSIYVGNRDLCGPPITKKCQEDETPPPPLAPDGNNRKGIDDEMVFLYISVVIGFVLGLWGFFVALLFNKSWRIAYCQLLDAMEARLVIVLTWLGKFWRIFSTR